MMTTRRLNVSRALTMAAAAALLASVFTPPLHAQRRDGAQAWVGTWATAVVGRPAATGAPAQPSVPTPAPTPGGTANAQPAAPAGGRAAAPPIQFNNQTLRQIVHTSIGGQRVRIVLSNRFGTAPMTIGAAHIALRDKDAAIVAGSDRALTFSGRSSTTIPMAAEMVSDPVELAIPSQADVAIDLYLPGDTAASASPLTMHAGANQTNYVSSTGNHAGESMLPVAATTPSWFLISRIEVVAADAVGAVIAFGDSITDGARSTADKNSRWPDHLASRLVKQPGGGHFAVLNLGIGGNRVLSEALPAFGINALARFDQDALLQPGATHLIVMEGINDIGMARPEPPPAADIIAGHLQLIERAHSRGLKVFGATLTPYEGAAYFSPQGETIRQAVNQWIRTSGAYDAVIDFDGVLRDPAAPTKFQAQYDSGDHLHPNDAGYAAMGNAVDLKLFAPRSSSR